VFTKNNKSKKSSFCVKHNIHAYPGILQSIDDQGCYTWMRAKTFMWSGFVLGMIITFTFLPVRLLFYTYVSPNWLGNLGMMSLIAAMVFAIVYYGKDRKDLLGKFSMAYRQRMSRFVHHKRTLPMFLGSQAFMIIIYLSVFYASTETVIEDPTPDINEFNMSMAYNTLPIDTKYEKTIFNKLENYDFNDIQNTDGVSNEIVGGMFSLFLNNMNSPETKEAMYDFFKNSRHSDSKFDANESDIFRVFTDAPKSVNTFTSGWSSHFSAVWLIGDIEYTALFFTYRKIYRKVDVGLPWKAVDAWKSRRGGFLYPIELMETRK
jgi:hypothetical protein